MNPMNEVTLKAYTIKELAAMYGISTKTFRGWLIPHKEIIGLKTGRYFTALQVKIIFERFGLPG